MKDLRHHLLIIFSVLITAATMWINIDVISRSGSVMNSTQELKNLEERLKSVPSSYKVVGIDSLYKTADEIGSLQGNHILVKRDWFHLSILLQILTFAVIASWVITLRRHLSTRVNESDLDPVGETFAENATINLDPMAKELIDEIHKAASHLEKIQQRKLTNQEHDRSKLEGKDIIGKDHSIEAQTHLIFTSAQDLAQSMADAQSMLDELSKNLKRESQTSQQSKIELNLLTNQLRTVKFSLADLGSQCLDLVKRVTQFSETTNDSFKSCTEISDGVKQFNTNLAQHSNRLQVFQNQFREAQSKLESCRNEMKETVIPIAALSQRAKDVEVVIETIDDITEQTNLLAINASIEASRAGEEGQGFAIVAEEIRQLALKSSHATRNIAELLIAIQTGAHQVETQLNVAAISVETAGDNINNFAASFTALHSQTAASSQMTNKLSNLCSSLEEGLNSSRNNSSSALKLATDISSRLNSFLKLDLPLFDKFTDISVHADRLHRSLQQQSVGIDKLQATLEPTKTNAMNTAKVAQNIYSTFKNRTPVRDETPALHFFDEDNNNDSILRAARELKLSAETLSEYGIKKIKPSNNFDIIIKQTS
jgi:methyl-accepting chemotaxis protein